MCGIGGAVRLGKAPIPKDATKRLLLGLEHRGIDASGMAWVRGDKIHFGKDATPASQFVINWNTSVPEDASIILVHTRAATHGSPEIKENNHPIIGNKGILIHNGVVNCPLGEPAYGEGSDSGELLGIIEKYGLQEAIPKVSGWLAIALILRNEPDKLYLYRDGSPMVAAMYRGIFYFASEENALPLPEPKRFGGIFRGVEIATIPQNTIVTVSLSGNVEMLSGVKPKVHSYTYTNTFSGKFPYYSKGSIYHYNNDDDIVINNDLEDLDDQQADNILAIYNKLDEGLPLSSKERNMILAYDPEYYNITSSKRWRKIKK